MGTQLDLARGSIDEQLITYAAMDISAEEISRRIGGVLSPARVQLRVREMLKAGDWLTEAEKERALLRLAAAQIGDLQEVAGSGNLDASKVLLQYLKDVLDRLEKRQSRLSVSLDTYSENVGRVLGRTVDLSLAYMKGALRDEVDSEKWDTLVEESLAMAWAEIEKHQEVEG